MAQNETKITNPSFTISSVIIDPFVTTNATVTTCYSFPTKVNQGVKVKVNGIAVSSTYAAIVSHTDFIATFLRAAGNVARTSVSDTSGVTGGIQGNFVTPQPIINVLANTATQSVDVTLTGKAATTINWNLQIEIVYTN